MTYMPPPKECESCGSRRQSTLLTIAGSVTICKHCNATRLQLESYAHMIRRIEAS